MGFLAGIVKTIISNVQNSDKMILCHGREMSECYIEFGLMANIVELTRARVNMLVISTNTI